MAAVYWVGNDGNVYTKGAYGQQGVNNQGKMYISTPDSVYVGSAGKSRMIKAKQIPNPGNPQSPAPTLDTSGTGGGGGGGGGAAEAPDTTADDLAYLSDQAAQLRSLLGRTDTGLAQGITKLDDDYNAETTKQNEAKTTAINNYNDNRVSTQQEKQGAFGSINRNGGNGYRSLAQIIGRASGTNSSAFRELLPNVVGKDISGKRRQASDTYGKNMQGIDKAQSATEISFSNILADLLKQRKSGEADLRTAIEGQRQGLQQQLAQNAGQQAKVRGGGYGSVRAAQAPYQAAINNSRNAVESFFNQFRTQYTPGKADIAKPDLAQYTVDRSVVNAQGQGQQAQDNPYADLLRKKLQDETATPVAQEGNHGI